jgi:hypothetical protein
MKPLLLLCAGFLLVGVLAAGVTFFLASGGRVQPAIEAAGPAPTAAPASSAADIEALRGEIAMLTRSLADLQSEVEGLRGSSLRQPLAVESELPTPESLAAAGLTPPQIEERMREVFAAEREREALEEKALREERERQSAARNAARIARDLGLGSADEKLLSEHLFASGQKRRELFDGARDGGFDREAMRASMEELRTWNTDQLYRIFSPSVAAQLEESGADMFGGGGRGFGGGRRGGNGEPAGNPPGGG